MSFDMGDSTAYRKIAMIIGTSAIAYVGLAGSDFSGHFHVPSSSYLSADAFLDPYQFKTSLKNETDEQWPVDDPIPVPVVKMMKFKFSKPEPKQFSI